MGTMNRRDFNQATFMATCVALLSMSAHAEPLELNFSVASGDDPIPDVLILVPTKEQQAPQNREMVQKDRRFHPHVLVVPKESRVDFPNRDNTQHHVYSFSEARTFDLELFADSPEKPVRFDKAGIVELGCNIHDHMQAFIIVTDHQRVLRSSNDGRLTIPEPHASRLMETESLKICHPRLRDNDTVRTVDFSGTDKDSLPVQLELIPQKDDGEFNDLQQRFQDL